MAYGDCRLRNLSQLVEDVSAEDAAAAGAAGAESAELPAAGAVSVTGFSEVEAGAGDAVFPAPFLKSVAYQPVPLS